MNINKITEMIETITEYNPSLKEVRIKEQHCRKCEDQTPHYYIGAMEFKTKRIELANCYVCHSTVRWV